MARDPREVAAVFAGGALGALARAAVSQWLPTDPGRWPWGTFAVNLVAAFLLGWAVTRMLERLPASNYRRPFLGTGVCGGLSTFSTMQVEIVRLGADGHVAIAFGYLAASLLCGLVVLHLATAVARRSVAR